MFTPKVARRLRSVIVGLLAGLLVVLIYTVFLIRTSERGGPAPDFAPAPVMAPDFSLVDQDGQPFSKADLQGKVWIADLTNAHCPGGCSTVSGNMALLRDRLYAQGLLGTHVMLVSFSSHPAVDTPERMKELATLYDADPASWRFLTGDPAYLEHYIGSNFFLPVDVLAYEKFDAEAPSYAIVRSNRFVLVDRTGQVRNYYAGDRMQIGREMELLLEEIQDLLLEG